MNTQSGGGSCFLFQDWIRTSLCLCFSAAERHQSEAERLSPAEAGGPASGVHHRPLHPCHPPSLLHPGRPAGLRRLREPSFGPGAGVHVLHPGGAQLHHWGTTSLPSLPSPNLCFPPHPHPHPLDVTLDEVGVTLHPKQ